MGQVVGRMPKTWQDLMEERDRVLHWSSEVLARIDDNINNEDTFLMDYDDVKIEEKVHRWILMHRINRDKCFREFIKTTSYRQKIERGLNQVRHKKTRQKPNEMSLKFPLLVQIAREVKNKIRKEYRDAYSSIRQFSKQVDSLGRRQRRIHARIQKLGKSCDGDVNKFAKKLGPLRSSVFNNLCISEAIYFQERRLFNDFRKRIWDIDRRERAECWNMIEKFIRKF